MDDKNIFEKYQLDTLKNIISLYNKAINEEKIPPSYILYLLSRFPDENKQNMYTKVNKVLLRDTLPKRKRIFLDYLARSFKD